MKCKAHVIIAGKRSNRQCSRKILFGNFCIFHMDYIERLQKEISELQKELKRVKSL